MSELEWGKRDKRGEWQPDPLPEPLFRWPWQPLTILKYLFNFIWPYNFFFASLAILSWIFFTPDLSRTASFEFGWITEIYLRNVVILTLFAGALHWRLYLKKGQGEKFKYTNNWLATNNDKFLFKNQTYDNMFWSLTSGCIIWTAYEAVTLWAYANEIIPYLDWRTHPIYFVFLMVAIVFLRLFHFYWVHRLTHWMPLYNSAHYLHHKNVNIGPWSGLSMHPIEHLLYLSGVLIHWVIPSHPIHAIFHLMHASVSPALGHAGFHKLVTKGEEGLIADNYFHYLHHRYFSVNFGHESVPLDKWFGSFHDGSPEVHQEILNRRKRAKKSLSL